MSRDVAQTATLVHGYTMARVDRLAHDAVRKSRGAAELLNPVDAREEAWQGIVEVLYMTPERPSEWSLVDAGARAIGERVRIDLRDQGIRQIKGGTGGYEDAPRFNSFWTYIIGPRTDWTDSIIDRMALPRALGTLTPAQYAAVAAVAAFLTRADEDDGGGTALAQAAAALHLEYATAKQRVNAARKKVRAVWFEHETPPGEKKVDKNVECRSGHARAEHGYINAAGVWACRVCHRLAERRRRARGVRYGSETAPDVAIELELAESPPEPLTFAPADDDPDALPTAANTCWCGLAFGHDWPHKEAGAAHPRTAA